MSDRVALPDVNVLIALSEPRHVHHNAAQNWFSTARDAGWATCPITETGFVRVVSSPAYPHIRFSPATAVDFLRDHISNFGAHYEYWPADCSLLDDALFNVATVQGHRQITDLYLLGLCIQHGGKLVTFDSALQTLTRSLVLSPTGLIELITAP
jgi:uncharacterized protein